MCFKKTFTFLTADGGTVKNTLLQPLSRKTQ